MASQVLSGTSDPSYTNNTGQNVRIVINYMAASAGPQTFTGPRPSDYTQPFRIILRWAGVSVTASTTNTFNQDSSRNVFNSSILAIGRNIAFASKGSELILNNMAVTTPSGTGVYVTYALPTEIMLAPGQTFSATCGVYNIVVIPEAG